MHCATLGLITEIQALADLSNAVVADPRVFSISERKFWEMYESQGTWFINV